MPDATLPKINADHPIWGPRLTALVDEIAPFYPQAFVDTLQAPWKEQVLWVRTSAADLLYAMKLYLTGFNLVRAGQTPTDVGTQGWVNGVSPPQSMRLQACIVASGFCALLEGILPEMAEQFATANELARIAKTREVEQEPVAAKAQLRRWANPTGKGDSKWAARTADLFGITISEDAKEALASMIALRHQYTHQRPAALTGETPADELSSWFFATMLFTTLAASKVPAR